MDIIGLVLGFIGLTVAFWQYMDAQKAKRELAKHMRHLPDQVLNHISSYLKGTQGEGLEFYDIQESVEVFHSRIADLDGDGEGELLVQHPFGGHHAALQVFGVRDQKLRLIAEITADTMAGFLVEDLDNDGRLAVKTLEVSPAADLPYVCGFRDEVWFRLDDGHFAEVRREPLYSKKELEEFKAREREVA